MTRKGRRNARTSGDAMEHKSYHWQSEPKGNEQGARTKTDDATGPTEESRARTQARRLTVALVEEREPRRDALVLRKATEL